MYSSASIINNYYKNPLIKQMYASSKGNMCGFSDSTLELTVGPHGISPSSQFMYADMN